jgi:integrase/recombinase XerC
VWTLRGCATAPGAVLGMAVEDVFTQNHWLWVRVHEKGGKQHAMSCHHKLEDAL